jgi:two-component system, NtrC family, sensor histidine kinase GlrK
VKLTIYKKMMIGFVTIILLMSIVSAYMVFELNAVSNAAHTTLTSDVQSINIAKQLHGPLYEEERFAQKYLISHDNAYFALFSEENTSFSDDLDSLMGIQSDPQKLEALRFVRTKHDAFAQAVYTEQVFAQTARKKFVGTFDQNEFQTFEVIRIELDRFIKMNQVSIDKAMTNVETTTQESARIALLLTTGALLVALTIAFFITRTITRPIEAVIRGTQQIARGAFEPIRVPSHDETALLADAVNDMGNQLKQINEYKAGMMRQISHELRTPLQTILSAQYILSEQKLGRLNPEQVRLLGSMRSNIDKLIKFTNAFLDIAKIEAGKMEYEMVLADLLSIVASAVEDAQVLAERKGVQISVSASPIPYVMADVEKLSQVFGNLVSNAIKYTGKGGQITIAVARNKAGARITLADTGVGIAPEDLPKIFTKFYQASNASKAGAKGTGLGLALVKAFVEGHGGTVSVASTVNVGTTFTIDLPAADLGTMTPSSPVVAQPQRAADGSA